MRMEIVFRSLRMIFRFIGTLSLPCDVCRLVCFLDWNSEGFFTNSGFPLHHKLELPRRVCLLWLKLSSPSMIAAGRRNIKKEDEKAKHIGSVSRQRRRSSRFILPHAPWRGWAAGWTGGTSRRCCPSANRPRIFPSACGCSACRSHGRPYPACWSWASPR